jgi:aspartyl protease family protein
MNNQPDKNSQQMGRGMIYMAWILVLGLLTLFFNNMMERQHNPNNDLYSTPGNRPVSEVVLRRNRAGHYVATGRINDQPVNFLVDTGATDVAIPAELADRLGLERGRSITSHTANGQAIGWTTQLDSVDLGGLVQYGVRSSILPGMSGDEVLLGMSYLKHLDLIQQGNTLTLRRSTE